MLNYLSGSGRVHLGIPREKRCNLCLQTSVRCTCFSWISNIALKWRKSLSLPTEHRAEHSERASDRFRRLMYTYVVHHLCPPTQVWSSAPEKKVTGIMARIPEDRHEWITEEVRGESGKTSRRNILFASTADRVNYAAVCFLDLVIADIGETQTGSNNSYLLSLLHFAGHDTRVDAGRLE